MKKNFICLFGAVFLLLSFISASTSCEDGSCVLMEGTTLNLNDDSIEISFMTPDDVRLKINGVSIGMMEKNEDYSTENNHITITDILYAQKDGVASGVAFGYEEILREKNDTREENTICEKGAICTFVGNEVIEFDALPGTYGISIDSLNFDSVVLYLGGGTVTDSLKVGDDYFMGYAERIEIKNILFVTSVNDSSVEFEYVYPLEDSHCKGPICILAEGDILNLRKDRVSIKFLDTDRVKLLINGISSGFLKENDVLSTENNNFRVNAILHNQKENGLSKIELGYEKTPISLVSSCKDNICILSEDDSVEIEGEEISINFVDSEEIELDVDGKLTGKLKEGNIYSTDKSNIQIKEILYNQKTGGISRVELGYEVIYSKEGNENTIGLHESEEIFADNSSELIQVCSGCLIDETCYNVGYREADEYCNNMQEKVSQVEAGSVCDNSFECKSNLCIDSECISEGFFKRIMSWFKRLFG